MLSRTPPLLSRSRPVLTLSELRVSSRASSGGKGPPPCTEELDRVIQALSQGGPDGLGVDDVKKQLGELDDCLKESGDRGGGRKRKDTTSYHLSKYIAKR